MERKRKHLIIPVTHSLCVGGFVLRDAGRNSTGYARKKKPILFGPHITHILYKYILENLEYRANSKWVCQFLLGHAVVMSRLQYTVPVHACISSN